MSRNRHFRNASGVEQTRREGPLCNAIDARGAQCSARWEPICPTVGCSARTTVLRIMREEKERGVTRVYAKPGPRR